MTKNPHAVALGSKGGKARMANLTEEEKRKLGQEAGRASGAARRAKAKKKK